MKQVNTILYKSNPNNQHKGRKDANAYQKYRREVRKSFLAWLFCYTCQDCGLVNTTRALHFHHLNPKDKLFNILQGGACEPDKFKLFTEILKCVYVCENCH